MSSCPFVPTMVAGSPLQVGVAALAGAAAARDRPAAVSNAALPSTTLRLKVLMLMNAP
jgi:hypothetical protein